TAGILKISVREGGSRGAEEPVIVAVHGAPRVAEHAVDAEALLTEHVNLLLRLAVFASLKGLLLLPDDVGLHAQQLVHEVLDVDDEVLHDRKVRERLHAAGAP